MKVFKIYSFRLGNISSTRFDELWKSGRIIPDPQSREWITATSGNSIHSCHILARVRAKTVSEAIDEYREKFLNS